MQNIKITDRMLDAGVFPLRVLPHDDAVHALFRIRSFNTRYCLGWSDIGVQPKRSSYREIQWHVTFTNGRSHWSF